MGEIKLEHVRKALRILNDLLPNELEVILSHRFHYLALDLNHMVFPYGLSRHEITSGLTERDAHVYIWAMIGGFKLGRIKEIPTPTTEVIFRVWKAEIIALFPYEISDFQGNCLSYMQVGQHGSADYLNVIKQSRPAKEEEFAELKKELVNLGYKLKVIKRRNAERALEGIRDIR